METFAHFTNIRSNIESELRQAKQSIFVAVAWFTDTRLFDILCQKASEGIKVHLLVMDDEITRNCSIDYSKLEKAGGLAFLINNETTGTLMHNKFCVIDDVITITGSYNWSIKATTNHENITITKGSADLAELFISEFKRIKSLYYGKDQLKSFDANVINKRLAIIEGYIQLNEYSHIQLHTNKIVEYEIPKKIQDIVDALNTDNYDYASIEINSYLIAAKSLTIYDESDLQEIKWQIKYLEIEIVSLENEKTTIEKIVAEFVHNYTIAFGALLLKILRLKKEKLQLAGNSNRSKEYEKAENEYNNFDQQYKAEQENTINELNIDEKTELKLLFRKAAALSHPDRFVDDAQKDKAHKVFVELQEAYSKNDLDKVRRIFHNLENGIYDLTEDIKTPKRELLLAHLNHLKEKYEKLLQSISLVRRDKTYKQILSINDMDQYFAEEKIKLENEIKIYQNG